MFDSVVKNGADPNAYYKSSSLNAKTIQPPVNNSELAIIRLLAIYGATKQGVYFKTGTEEARACLQANYCIHGQLRGLKIKLKEARDNKDLAKIQEYCQRLNAIWEKLKETEKDNLIFKKSTIKK